MIMYAYGQKKTHLLGQSDDAVNAVGIQVTLANNYYKDSMDRMPRLRYGDSHFISVIISCSSFIPLPEFVKFNVPDHNIA